LKNSLNNGKPGFTDLVPKEITEGLVSVEEKIRQSLFVHPDMIEKIGKHIMDSGGKRLRPILHLLSARIGGYSGPDTTNVATATELVHTATLLHDDVIDLALTRRGKPSANILWGNKSSILVGDYLFSRSVMLVVELNNLKIVNAFAKAFSDLSVGEMLEVLNEHNLNVTLDSYFDIINKKTSSLFKLCMETGAYYTSSASNLNGSLSQFGINFGTTFQLVDDYLDYFGDAHKMGKPVMGDFKEKKVTFPLITLNKLCSDKEREELKEIFYQPNPGEAEDLFVKGLMEKYEINKIMLETAKKYSEKAYGNLKEVKDSIYKSSLLGLLEYNLTRDR
jgi:octaprenyl-diphosphate synthase